MESVKEKKGIFKRFTSMCVRVMERWLPDPFIFCALLTFLVFGGALIFTKASFFGVIGLVTRGRPHQLFKSFGLVLGALTQAILANGYVSQFPPLDMQMVICAGLSVWYLLAVFYVFRCEGINE